jgi:LPXTG-site transpeptidase (sortase) family protein
MVRSLFGKVRLAAGGFGLVLTGHAMLTVWDGVRGQRSAKVEWEASHFQVTQGRWDDRPEPETFRLTVPRLKIERYVFRSYSQASLALGPAWLEQTSEPGCEGNCIIAGHRDTHFRFLRLVRVGDEVTLQRAGRSYEYRVQSIRIVDKDATHALRGAGPRSLTLVTCYPFFFVGAAQQRYLVQAVAQPEAPESSRQF